MGVIGKKIQARLSAVYDFIACFLIILSHFTNYILYAEYSRLFPDILIILVCICLAAVALVILLQLRSKIVRAFLFAGLITIVLSDALYEFGVADISSRLMAMSLTLLVVLAIVFLLRRHTSTVIIAAFLAILFSTLVIGVLETSDHNRTAATGATTSKNQLPVIVHLILDEHIGLAGIDPQLPNGPETRNLLKDFYEQEGFRLYSRAYSQYVETAVSLATALNFDTGAGAPEYLTHRRYGYSLDRNAYLSSIAGLGYDINIYQSNYFDLCAAETERVRKCVTYKPDALDADQLNELPLTERLDLIGAMYVSSITLVRLIKLAERPLRRWLADRNISLPPLGLWHGRLGPIAVASTMARLEKDIAESRGGTLFFAHLLLPHYPYVYMPDCTIRQPVRSWKNREPDSGQNTEESRRERYREYFDQVRCTVSKLRRLFDSLKTNGTFDRATIIVHGDHGSRINLGDPEKDSGTEMSPDEFSDNFSTLFAIKAPGVVPGIDNRVLALSDLLGHSLSREEQHLSGYGRRPVYLTGNGSGILEFPTPENPFGAR